MAVYLLLVLVFAMNPLRRMFLPLQMDKNIYFFAGKRIEYFDFLKGVAIIAVIIVHISYLSLILFKGEGSLFLFELNNLTRFAIPFFLIISGILSTLKYNQKMDLKKYYFGKFFKLYLPFAFFTILVVFLHDKDISNLPSYLVNGLALTPYYFVILILQLYILFPLLRHLKDSRFFLFFSFVVSLIFFTFNDLNTINGVILFPKFLFFFVYGMYYRNNFMNYKVNKSHIKYWYFIVFMYIFVTLILPDHYFNFRPFFGIAIFNLFFIYKKQIIAQFDDLYNFLINVGKNSIWIYFTHFSLLAGLFYLLGLFLNNLYVTVLIVFVVSLPLSFLIGSIFSKIYSNILNTLYGAKNK